MFANISVPRVYVLLGADRVFISVWLDGTRGVMTAYLRKLSIASAGSPVSKSTAERQASQQTIRTTRVEADSSLPSNTYIGKWSLLHVSEPVDHVV